MSKIKHDIKSFEFHLPPPWEKGSVLQFENWPDITWLVGPNGAGKSRFLSELHKNSTLNLLKPRLISTDRLNNVRPDLIRGGHYNHGINKSEFPQLKQANHAGGILPGAVSLLYERPDIQIRVEATLSQLLERRIQLEMVDGRLQAKMFRSSIAYSLFQEECHGVLELIVLLTNIYDDETQLLLLDEPEQNLHPQYQSFILDEIKRSKKTVVIATHSPSFLNIRSLDELKSVFCFHKDFRVPTRYKDTPEIDHDISSLIPRITEQHRTFFFATKPIFAEGPKDATLISSIQSALELNAEAAGSCIIPCGGKEEAIRYLKLCNALNKEAIFIFDLDALFDFNSNVITNIAQYTQLQERIVADGHNKGLEGLLGELRSELTILKNLILNTKSSTIEEIKLLIDFITNNVERGLTALAIAAQKFPEKIVAVGFQSPNKITGLLSKIFKYLAESGIYILPYGELENHLPSYNGCPYKVADNVKNKILEEELMWLLEKPSKDHIVQRYGKLSEIIEKLPSKQNIDIRPFLKRFLADHLHFLIKAIRAGEIKTQEQIASVLGEEWKQTMGFLKFSFFHVENTEKFSGELLISDKFGVGELICCFDQDTQTNNPEELKLEASNLAVEGIASEEKLKELV